MILYQKNNKFVILMLHTIISILVTTSKTEVVKPDINSLPNDENGFYKIFPSESHLKQYKKAAVATSSEHCAKAGAKILKKGGSAVDAAIAALLCEGVVSFQGTGIGGGFLMTIWNAKEKKSYFLNAREYAPAAAYNNILFKNPSCKGGASVAIPGEVAGYWEAHQKFGKLPWKDLFEDAIKLCENGFLITKYLANTIKRVGKIYKDVKFPSVKQLVTAEDGETLLDVGHILKRPNLAKTLKIIQKLGKNGFYDGIIADSLLNDIRKDGGLITKEEFKNYKPIWKKPLYSTILGKTVISAPTPGSGALFIMMLNVLENLIPSAPNKNVMWQRIVETFKWAYANKAEIGDFIERPEYANKKSKDDCKVSSKKAGKYDYVEKNGTKFDKDCLIYVTQKLLISKDYAKLVKSVIKDDKTYNDLLHYNFTRQAKDDHGTSHTSVYAPDGSAVSVTASINYICGSLMYSKETGIILNNQMDDYSFPEGDNPHVIPSEFNFIRSGNLHLRPQSSMAPTIVINNDKTVRLVIGGAGGPLITTGVVIATVEHLFLGKDIKTSLDHPRIHHQLIPMQLNVQPEFDREVVKYLKSVGHKIVIGPVQNSLAAIAVYGPNRISTSGEYRRMGGVDGF